MRDARARDNLVELRLRHVEKQSSPIMTERVRWHLHFGHAAGNHDAIGIHLLDLSDSDTSFVVDCGADDEFVRLGRTSGSQLSGILLVSGSLIAG